MNNTKFLRIIVVIAAITTTSAVIFFVYVLGHHSERIASHAYTKMHTLQDEKEEHCNYSPTYSSMQSHISKYIDVYHKVQLQQYLKYDVPYYILYEFFNESRFNHIAVHYHNIATGFTFNHNPNRVYFAASTTKAPFALYIYKKAEQGKTDLNYTHIFKQQYYTQGSGIIRHNYELGHTFNQHQLLGYNLYLSDNIALRMLRSIHGVDGFRKFTASLGANPNLIYNITYSRTTATQLGIFAKAMYDYINSNSIYSRQFLNHLLNNHYTFITSSYPTASKTGWWQGFGGAWHELAIIYAPSPYILVILSDNYGGSDTPLMQEISEFIEEFNRYFLTTGK